MDGTAGPPAAQAQPNAGEVAATAPLPLALPLVAGGRSMHLWEDRSALRLASSHNRSAAKTAALQLTEPLQQKERTAFDFHGAPCGDPPTVVAAGLGGTGVR